MPNKSESAIERKLGKEIKKLGGLSIKLVSPTMPGAPDRLIFLPWRRLYLVELKSAIGVLSKLQLIVHKMFAAIGWPVYVVSNDQELNDFIEEVSI